MKFLRVNEPKIIKQDIDEVTKTLKQNWLSSSCPPNQKFEKNFSKFIGHKYCSLVSSGSAALDIAIKCLKLKPKSEIIIPTFTIVSNLLCVLNNKLKPVLVDCDKKTWNLNIDDFKKKITKKTKAIIVPHIYNYPAKIELIRQICKKKKIFLVEDAAELIGGEYKKKKIGSFGDISIFSFYANKHITSGEGGALTTNNKIFNQRAGAYRNLCFGKKKRFYHSDIGWNYRMTSIQGSLLINQLKRIKKIIQKKIEIGRTYHSFLKNNKNIYIPEPIFNGVKNYYWVIAIVIKKKVNINVLKKKLLKKKIETRDFFFPMHKQKKIYKFKGKFPNADYISKNGIYLPSSLNLKKKDIKYICDIINKYTK